MPPETLEFEEPIGVLLKEIEAQGVQVARLSADELKAFRDATRAVYDKWKARIGADLVSGAERAVAAGR